jgi:thymidylate synthase (FAD)
MITVDLLGHMGSDLSVVNAARVSFDKASELVYDKYTVTDDYGLEYELTGEGRLSERDTKLIKYLAEHNHWSPFAHCFVSFRVRAPVFVARQLQKHTVGLAWNEVSRRYVDDEPTFYTPETWRKRAENVKQGSSDEAVTELSESMYIIDFDELDDPYVTEVSTPSAVLNDIHISALETYNLLLESGVCPEQARMVLPQSMMTQWIWSGSLYAFARVCNLRLDPHAQYETRLVAEGISKHMAELFPESWKVLINERG